MATAPITLPEDDLLLLYCRVNVKTLEEFGKAYPWERQETCPGCGSRRLWGHGYAARYFAGFVQPLWVKRYLCADCGGVHTCLPMGYWGRYQHAVTVVATSLMNKILHGRWLRCLSRQLQQYWYGLLRRGASRERTVCRPTMEQLQEFLSRAP